MSISRIGHGFLIALGCLMADELAAEVVWAVNVGGPSYQSLDGTRFVAEESVQGGMTRKLEQVLGSQDDGLYSEFREGDIKIARPVSNGDYDLTFHFAEPDGTAKGDRVFDVFAEGNRVINDLDVMLFRDGKIKSALTVTVPDVQVNDETLNIHFQAQAGQPILSAVQVRSKTATAQSRKLVWSDEFEGSGSPDPARWNIEEWLPGAVNGEDQAYTARPRNLRQESGNLVIEAHREDYQGAHYTSARIQSQGKGDFLYGRIEVRARLPRGQGSWPAIWMLPSNPFKYATTCTQQADWQGNEQCDAWPNSGEIDIMEHVGYQMNHIHATVHSADYYWVNWQQRKGRMVLDDVADSFHVYALEWSPRRIEVLVDGVSYFSYENEHAGWRRWPFDQPFHLILNLAVGGAWGRAGGPIDDTALPQQLLVDYVRVYQNIE